MIFDKDSKKTNPTDPIPFHFGMRQLTDIFIFGAMGGALMFIITNQKIRQYLNIDRSILGVSSRDQMNICADICGGFLSFWSIICVFRGSPHMRSLFYTTLLDSANRYTFIDSESSPSNYNNYI